MGILKCYLKTKKRQIDKAKQVKVGEKQTRIVLGTVNVLHFAWGPKFLWIVYDKDMAPKRFKPLLSNKKTTILACLLL